MKTLKTALIEQRDGAISQKAFYLVQKSMHDGLNMEDMALTMNNKGESQQNKRGEIVKKLDNDIESIDLIISKIDGLLDADTKS